MVESTLGNYVLVEVEYLFHKKIVFKSGGELFIDPTYEPEKHHKVSGIVKAVPDTLYFNNKDIETSSEFNVPIELKEGDEVFFHYLQIHYAITENRILTIDGKLHIFVRYDSCFCAIREEEMVMLNGWILLEPYGEDKMLTSDILQLKLPSSRQKPHPLKGTVAHIGKPVDEYLWSKHESDFGINVALGDNVVFLPHSDIPLEYGIHRKLDKIYYRVQRKDLLTKIS